MVAFEAVTVEIADQVAIVTLNAPHKRNALSRQLVADLLAAIDAVGASDARVIVLTHAPPVFCAGADLKERAAGPADSRPMAEVMSRLATNRLPVIAAITGAVRAGGLGLMAACDLIVVDASIDFSFTEVRLGLVPAIISEPILRRTSPSALAAAYLTGEVFSAAEARSMGLVTHVANGAAAVWATVADLVNGILASEPEAVAATKSVLWNLGNLLAEERMPHVRALSDRFFNSPGGAEGMASFAQKRLPSWAAPTPWTPPRSGGDQQ